MAARLTVINTASGGNTGHPHQHGPGSSIGHRHCTALSGNTGHQHQHGPNCIRTMSSIMVLGDSTSHSHQHGPQWQPRPQTFARTSGFNTAWGSRPWIPPWPPGAAWIIDVIQGGPIQKMNCSSSQTSVTTQNLYVSLRRTPRKHFPRRGFEQEPL